MIDTLWEFVASPWTLRPDTALGASVLALIALLLAVVLGWSVAAIARRLDLRNENAALLLLAAVGLALVLVLFVAVGASWSLDAIAGAAAAALAMVVVRALAKGVVVQALAWPSGLSRRQAWCLGAGLLPMSATAWMLGIDFATTHPGIAAVLMSHLLAMLALLELAAPLVVMASLRACGEVDRGAVR